jgi:Holliday junction resolvase-like predicted endonuclease
MSWLGEGVRKLHSGTPAKGSTGLSKEITNSFEEVHLVEKVGDVIVFIEVMALADSAFGRPFEAVVGGRERMGKALLSLMKKLRKGVPARLDVSASASKTAGKEQSISKMPLKCEYAWFRGQTDVARFSRNAARRLRSSALMSQNSIPTSKPSSSGIFDATRPMNLTGRSEPGR